MNDFRLTLLRIFQVAERVSFRSCQVAVVCMTSIVLGGVFFRYFLHTPFSWAEEASIFFMIWMTFIGAGVALRRGAHIAVTTLVNRMPPPLAKSIYLISSIAILIFLCVLAWKGLALSQAAEGQWSPALGVPMRWPYMVIPLGAVLMICQVLAIILDLFPPKPTPGHTSK